MSTEQRKQGVYGIPGFSTSWLCVTLAAIDSDVGCTMRWDVVLIQINKIKVPDADD
jgi:hypothetical protein